MHDIPCMFRPMDGLWGATVAVGNLAPGIIVTNKLELAMQRFTLAHELGHILLGHAYSFDKTVGFSGQFGSKEVSNEEIAADSFASELLGARSLIRSIAQKKGWSKKSFSNPTVIYQLALRLGLSYVATCWALVNSQIISPVTGGNLADFIVKKIKLSWIKAQLLTNPWANVWELDITDSMTLIEASADDVFVLNLEDQVSAGYEWILKDSETPLTIIAEFDNGTSDNFGAPVKRKLLFKLEKSGTHRVYFQHARIWNGETADHIDIKISNYGKETGGMARRVRETLLAAAY